MRWYERWNSKRLVVLALAPGMLGLGVDSAISHFAGKPVGHPAQVVAVAYALIGAVALGLFALRRFSTAAFRLGLRIVGASSAAVGLSGTFFHLRPLLKELAKEDHLSFGIIEGAVSLTPPLFAPGAFVALGALVWLLASPKVKIELTFAPQSSLAQPRPLHPEKAESSVGKRSRAG